MFDRFSTEDIDTGDAVIRARVAGSGPPLLLLHGYPQTHVMWHGVAPLLTGRFTVVATDLRGYGDSSKPPGGDDHAGYSFRAMAGDQVKVMERLGFDSFFVAGHDRGARTAHRMALDHPGKVRKLALLDIIPTLTLYETADKRIATGYYHWYFLIQPYDFPERLIGADPEYFLSRIGGGWGGRKPFAPEAMAEYLRCFSDPATIHATCEDYRAAAGIDLDHDRGDLDRKITCPVLVLWGAAGLMGRAYDVLNIWRERAETVSGRSLDTGHFIPEEAPEETGALLAEFFSG